MTSNEFADLPDALVRDLLAVAMLVAEQVKQRVVTLAEASDDLRRAAQQLIRRKADLERPREPSVAAVDGSYQIHTLTSVDICAAAAVAVEGAARQAKRYWPEPYHDLWAGGLRHCVDATGVLRALMVSMEMDLARKAPHDLVMLDGSLGSLIIYLNQGLTTAGEVPHLGAELTRRWHDERVMRSLLDLLRSDRVIAVPKFTSRNELRRAGNLPDHPAAADTDGRTLATVILHPGEYTSPLPAYVDERGEPQAYHLPDSFADKDTEQAAMNRALADVRVIYFRPFGWVPALRLELPGAIANSPSRLSMALEGVEGQFFSPAVTEPYPLFVADRMVKSLGAGVNALEHTIAQHVVDGDSDVQTSILCMQNYRTQGGRGGTS
ncbi:DNA double-strand break repair nuclease NurA [Micromonospora globbae]|uniref:DNA double-strand break repair nuclease NurA n=1 Tax=Micromonospora globbae TaxID=1894969 RepID=UPI0037A0B213